MNEVRLAIMKVEKQVYGDSLYNFCMFLSIVVWV